ncbi:DUF4389 domain-containing protein [Candidatus Synchoanobacter obligatus]|uniref:DUF4389 domain-containing protein n=1 Tax=Candidatus Synchoanobacter obligatus TaxID=2919597 RepID=A0ABT1L4S4_9GAMM|nr:DUF4389 domain-containing protein [Candidatus Synchoanobacter obligatus]MCP8352167.1 DUF4389 domain-containing protein [Candidatus Synchoanobacter obligatus]
MSEVNVNIPYQERHSRLSVFLRPLLALPVIVAMLLMIVPNHSFNPFRVHDVVTEEVSYDRRGNVIEAKDVAYYDLTAVAINGYEMVSEKFSWSSLTSNSGEATLYSYAAILGAYFLFVPLVAFSLWFMYVVNLAVAMTLLFRKKYPSWWFHWNKSLQSFVLRIYCYALFLTDKYPSLEEEDSVIKLALPNPSHENLNRFMPLVKWLLVLPYLAIYLVCLTVSFALVPLTYFLILVTGKMPRWIHRYHVAVINFYLRIAAYALLLVTDKYPNMIFLRR